MALPVTFAALTSATGANLDSNFTATGKIGSIPCAASGTNAITLTPTAGITPTIAAYANGLQFSAIVTGTNTTATTLRVNALAALNCYKDTSAGPTALSGGELIIGNAFTAVYDSALNTGAGGWHIYTGTTFLGGVITSNLQVSNASLSVTGTLTGATLTSTLLSGNSLTLTGVLASVTQLMVGASASSITRMISRLATLTYTVTPANATQDANFTLDGTALADSVSLGLGANVPAGAGFTGFMVAAGTVTVRLINPSTVTIGAATLTVRGTAMGFT